MTHPSTITKEQLAAFADGELSPEEAAAIVMHLADHPDDQAYVDEVMAANLALARAFAAPLQEPVPDHIAAMLLPETSRAAGTTSNIVAFTKPNRTRLTFAAVVSAGMAIAASVAAVAFYPALGPDLSVGPVAENSELLKILSATASGEAVAFGRGRALTILASLPAKTGDCREFEVVSTDQRQIQIGLACQDGQGWVIDVLLAETMTADIVPSDTYAPASGDDIGALDLWLDRRGAGLVMTPSQEAERIAAGWAQQ